MTIEELGRLIGDVIIELENASVEIEGIVGMLVDVDGVAILPAESDEQTDDGSPYMTIEELGELIGNALSELESVTAGIEGTKSALQSIDGIVITSA